MAEGADGVPDCAVALIEAFEGYAEALPDGRCRAYPDPAKGWALPTIGFGTTRYPDGSRVKKGDVITRDLARECLRRHLETRCRPALEKIPAWRLMNANQRGALYSFAYNLGAHFYRGDGFVSMTRLCDFPDLWSQDEWVRAQFEKYRSPGTPLEKGLRRRRRVEAERFCMPVRPSPQPSPPGERG